MKVVNMRTLDPQQFELCVYVGRHPEYYKGKYPFERSLEVLSNKFYFTHPNPDRGMIQCESKGQAIAAYRSHLWCRINSLDERILAALASIAPHELLGCWCSPAPCHADAIVATINNLNKRLTQTESDHVTRWWAKAKEGAFNAKD